MAQRKKVLAPPVATINIYGPDGELVPAGTDLPPEWSPEYVADLIRSGGATQSHVPEEN